jgi:undecaprenyl-diphosphatase
MVFNREKRQTALSLLVCVIVCAFLGNFAIKPIFRRTRPCNHDTAFPNRPAVKRPSDSSFPSCHALTSVAAAVTLCHAGWFLGMSSLVIASLISFSRMYLYVHYPSDVLIGAMMGVAAGSFFML